VAGIGVDRILGRVESTGSVRVGLQRRPVDARTAGFRPDIEGLRAFAVLLVVVNHLRVWPDGGFVGVDVFFTISGFLITGLIADEIDRTGRFSIRSFYLRRARRILPAAVAVLLATWIAARVVFFSERVHDTVIDIWWCLGFAANIHFANAGTSYFQTYQQPSLVQHYWSLAVEEQFYLIWPLLLLAGTLWARKRAGARAGRWVLVIGLAGAVASFGLCVLQTSSNPQAAYFSTFGRAWELIIGALVALAARRGLRVPEKLSGPLCLLGLAGIVGSAAVLTSASTFPGPGAVLPVLAGAVVLLSGCGASTFSTLWHLPVVNPVSRFIGRVSFSLYLWHWPTILFVDALVPPTAGIYYPLAVAAMASLTVFSYYAIEIPFHQAAAPRMVPPSAVPQRGGNSLLSRSRPVQRGMAVVTLVACTLLLYSFRPAQPAAVNIAEVAVPTAPSTGSPTTHTTELHSKIAASLRATAWPVLNPTLPEVLSGKTPSDGIAKCVGPDLPAAELCSYGSPAAAKLALVVGDSTAAAYMELLNNIVADDATNWRVRYIGMAGCTFNEIRIDNPVKWVAAACPARKQNAIDTIKRLHPDLVLVTNNFAAQTGAATRSKLSVDAWAAGLKAYVDHFRADTADIVFLAPPPVDVDIVKCYDALSVPAKCVSRVTANWSAYGNAVRAIATAERGHYIDSSQWFCVSNMCPAFVGTVATKRDSVHITSGYADLVAPAAYEAFSAAGLFGR